MKRPIDLYTVTRRLRRGTYDQSAGRLRRDIFRIFNNCETFNRGTNQLFVSIARDLKVRRGKGKVGGLPERRRRRGRCVSRKRGVVVCSPAPKRELPACSACSASFGRGCPLPSLVLALVGILRRAGRGAGRDDGWCLMVAVVVARLPLACKDEGSSLVRSVPATTTRSVAWSMWGQLVLGRRCDPQRWLPVKI